MSKLCIVAHFCGDFDSSTNNRFNDLSERFFKKGVDVSLITSDFSHIKKIKRNANYEGINYNLSFISEPCYNKNVSIRRMLSHFVFSMNLKKHLKKMDKPDLIYCGVPSIGSAYVTAKYATKNKIDYVIDIQDLWPEAFGLISTNFISKIIYSILKSKIDYVYKNAKHIVAVSETYLNRALEINKKAFSKIVYLGTSLKKFDCHNPNKSMKKNSFTIGYAGTLGHSYDLESVIKAIAYLRDNEGIVDIKFLVMGDGPLMNSFIECASTNKIEHTFTGRLPYTEMISKISECDVLVNPIKKGAAQSVTNKHADYSASGKPIINSQENLEYRNIVSKFNMGINCVCEDYREIAYAIKRLYLNPTEKNIMGINSRRCAEDLFDRDKTYTELVNYIESIVRGKNNEK